VCRTFGRALASAIEYDPNKSEWTFRARGIDFDFAARVFDGAFIEWPSPRYGESRFLAVGCVDDILITVTYAWRGGNRRIISARPARRKERDVYRAQVS
jgi:hypothetical protein